MSNVIMRMNNGYVRGMRYVVRISYVMRMRYDLSCSTAFELNPIDRINSIAAAYCDALLGGNMPHSIQFPCGDVQRLYMCYYFEVRGILQVRNPGWAIAGLECSVTHC